MVYDWQNFFKKMLCYIADTVANVVTLIDIMLHNTEAVTYCLIIELTMGKLPNSITKQLQNLCSLALGIKI